MAGSDDKSSKTEEATSKRRDEAFKEGNFAKSPDIGVVFVLLSSLIVVVFYGKQAGEQIAVMSTGIFAHLHEYPLTQETATDLLMQKLQECLLIVLPLLVACALGAIVSGSIQSGLKLTSKVIEPKLDRLDPVKGLKNVFSINSLVRGILDTFKFIIIAFVIYYALKSITRHEIFAAPIAVIYVAQFIYETFISMMIWLVLSMGLIAIAHYLYQRRKISKDLRMSKQEVKDERKEQEGNPLVRSAQRSMARRLLQNQMLDEVSTADVVVTNPTHYAVAIKYETGKDLAPMVIAKGENMFAKRIKQIAAEHEVPMVENKPAARILYKICRVGEVIPSNLYQIIAEILVKVYQSHKYYFHRLKARREERRKEP